MRIEWNLEEDFHRLGPDYYTLMPPEGVGQEPLLVHGSERAAVLLDLPADIFAREGFASTFSGKEAVEDFRSLAMVYSGHQFGGYVPRLGDGRALLIAQVRNRAGELWDVQLKGGGRTPYSRFGDGRAVLRSCIREYLCSEAMAALGIPTSRALCVVATREGVRREKVEPGAVLTRLAKSHVRFGHFEYFHYTQRPSRVAELIEFVRERHFAELQGAPVVDWYREVVRRTALLMADWQAVGFAHGVMNTDNMSILGITLDYGPFGFVETYDPKFICNHSDESGRYAFGQQPSIGKWNLWALANALLSQVSAEELTTALQEFDRNYALAFFERMRAKLGLVDLREEDSQLLYDWQELLEKGQADYTLAMRRLADGGEAWEQLFAADSQDAARAWRQRCEARWKAEPDAERRSRMLRLNPKFVLRNWLAETAIRAVEDRGEVARLDEILRVLESPFDEHPEYAWMAAPAAGEMRHLCVSCSS
jgi:serine/tyrosine/threonine adenylyltransferase